MHRIFEINEIVAIIAGYLDQSDLDDLGRVHPAFNELALDRRWHHVRGLDTVMTELRAGVRSLRGSVDEKSKHKRERQMSLELLRRVRRMEYTFTWPSSVDNVLLRSLLSPDSIGGLLPRLRSLDLVFDTHPNFESVRILLSPSLESLSLAARDYSREHPPPFPLAPILHAVAWRCQDLRSLSITLTDQVKQPTVVELEAFHAAFTSLRNLRRVTLDGVYLRDIPLYDLAKMPRLEKLRLCHLSNLTSKLWAACVPCDIFASLTALTIVCEEISSLISLLQVTASTHIQRVSVTATGSQIQPVREFCELIASRWPKLVSFCIEYSLPQGSKSMLTAAQLVPLQACRGMRNVGALGMLRLAMQNEDIHAMACAWPQLQSMYFVEGVPGHRAVTPTQPPSLTRASLDALASHCRNLEYLGLSVDFDAPNGPTSDDNQAPVIHPPSRLENLDLGLSILSDPSAIASYLRALFPSLRTLDYTRRAHWITLSTPHAGQENARESRRVRLVLELNDLLGTRIEGDVFVGRDPVGQLPIRPWEREA